MKRFASILLLTLFTLGVFLNMTIEQPVNAIENQVLTKVETFEDAQDLEIKHNIQLINYSRYGLATYTVSQTQYETLLSTGDFHPNTLYQSEEIIHQEGNPFRNQEDDQYALDLMQFHDAWGIQTGQNDIVVAVIDTGVNHTLDIFEGRILETSYNAVTGMVGLDAVMDDQGHGTIVTSIIAASHDDTSYLGAAPGIQILKIKANSGDELRSFTAEDLINSVYYAIEQGADVINLSLGGGSYNSLLEEALQAAYDAGIINIAASGNDGEEKLYYPAGYDSVITVSSIDKEKNLSTFSNYGDHVDLAAPGENILVIDIDGKKLYSNGTSLSAPYVSSVFALVKSQYPTLSTQELIERVFVSAEDIGDSLYFGHGLANIYNALTIDFVEVSLKLEGDLVDTVVVTKDTAYTLPVYEKDNHDFYWYETNDYTNKITEDTIYPSTDITLYGRFEIFTYTVNFYDEDRTVLLQSTEVPHGSDAIPPDDPTKASTDKYTYTFSSWSEDYTNVTKDLNIYPEFEETLNQYTVSFYDEDQTTLLKESTVNHGEDAIPPSDPTKESSAQYTYTFSGWSSSYEVVTEDSIVYATYEATINQYTVTFYDYDLETVLKETIVDYGSQVSAPNDPTKPTTQKYTFTFKAWDTAHDYISEDTNVYPLFNETLNQYTVTFYDYDLETVLKEVSVEYGSGATPPEDPQKPDKNYTIYTFIDWDKDYDTITDTTKIFPLYDEQLYEYEVELINTASLDTIDTLTVEHGTTIETLPHEMVLIDDESIYLLDETRLSTDSITTGSSIEIFYDAYALETFFTLNKSVDTIKQHTPYTDQGMAIAHQNDLFKIITSSIDTSALGTQTFTYTIYYDNEIIYTLDRFIVVVPQPEDVIITLNPGIDSLFIGDTYQDAGATTNYGTITTINNVDTSRAGLYKVIYQVKTDKQVINMVRYVTILEPPNTLARLTPYLEKKEAWYYA